MTRLSVIAAVFCGLVAGAAGAGEPAAPPRVAPPVTGQPAGFSDVNPPPPQAFVQPGGACRDSGPVLNRATIVERLRAQGYYGVRDLRFQPLAISTRARPVGRYVATASHGFGFVRWHLTIDPCSGLVLKAEELPATRTH